MSIRENLCMSQEFMCYNRAPYKIQKPLQHISLTYLVHIYYTLILEPKCKPNRKSFFFFNFLTFSGTLLEWTHQKDLKLSCNAKLWSLFPLWWTVVCCDATICGSEKPRYYDDASLWRLWNFIIAMKQEVFVPYPISPKFLTFDNGPGLRKYTCHSHCATYWQQ